MVMSEFKKVAQSLMPHLSFPAAKVEGRPQNALSLQLTPPLKEDSWGSSDDEA